MHDQLGSIIIFAAVGTFCLYHAVRALIGRPSIAPEPKRTDTAHIALHVPAESPADAEWRRRLARWTAEQDAS
jgi:hypothetical protein